MSRVKGRISIDISIQDLEVSLGQSPEIFNFRIPKLKISSGEFVVLTGPSGKGKTTLLHACAGLLNSGTGVVKQAFPKNNLLKHRFIIVKSIFH